MIRLLFILVLLGTAGCSGCRSADNGALTVDGARVWFSDATADVKLEFLHDPGAQLSYRFPQVMGSGLAVLDFDGDGDLDVYALNGEVAPLTKGGEAVNRLYRQEADGTFTDATDASRLGDPGYGTGVAVGDLNNDGLPDVYVANAGVDRLYINQGGGTFEAATDAAGIDNPRWATSVCLLDFDRDGWLDIYVTNYVDYSPTKRCFAPSGEEDFCSPMAFPPTADKLYRNATGERASRDASGGASPDVSFVDVSSTSRIADRPGPGLGVVAADFSADGWPDIYVANDGAANVLWVNQRDGTFRDEAVFRGLAFDGQGRPQAGMGIALTDLNDDPYPDLLVTHLSGEMNALYVSDPAGTYQDLIAEKGLGQAGYPRTGFGVAFADLNNDGNEEIVVVNGRVTRPDSVRAKTDSPAAFWSVYAEPNQVFRNNAGRFEPMSEAGPLADLRDVSRSLCVADMDDDGDLDFLVGNTAGPLRFFRNECPESGSWLSIECREPSAGRRLAHGARVVVTVGERERTYWLSPSAGYQSAQAGRIHVGLGNKSTYQSIEVHWPNGDREQFRGGNGNRRVILFHGEGQLSR